VEGSSTSTGSAASVIATNGEAQRGLAAGSSTSRQPLVQCRGVVKSYDLGYTKVAALRGVDLLIDEPGFFGIMGPSGSGKSTLLHLLAALDSPESGTVEVNGIDLSRMTDKELTAFRRTKIGIVFQQFNLIPTLTAIENIRLPAMLAGTDNAEVGRRAEELLERLGLPGRSHHRPDALSGGEQQRVAIARALLFKPRILYADEPTGNLDSASSKRLWALLKDIASEQQLTIVMVTHEPSAAVNCKRVFVLTDGVVRGIIEVENMDAGGMATRYQQLVSAVL
jgi:putative ABC transport system ATP-binding protein